jgi:hypothetical protein
VSTLNDGQVSVIRRASLMLQTLTSTFTNPSTTDPIRGAAANNFATLLQDARTAFPMIPTLNTITAPSSGDSLPGLIAALAMLVGALPDVPEGERYTPGYL